jgi:hypothetical protein
MYIEENYPFRAHHSMSLDMVEHATATPETQNIPVTPKSSLMSLCSPSTPSLLDPVNQHMISVLIECHINGIVWYVDFCVWLLSLGIMHLKSITVVTCICSLLLVIQG